MTELSKREKKIARELIEKGLQAEFKAGVEEVKKVITAWQNQEFDNKEAYYKLYNTITDRDKRIAKRYDGMRGSRYMTAVAVILYDGQITEEDIKDFNEETKEKLIQWVKWWKEEDDEDENNKK